MVAEVKIRNIEHTILINDVRVVKELNNDDFNVYDDFTNLVFLDTHYIFVGSEILCVNGTDIEYVCFYAN